MSDVRQELIEKLLDQADEHYAQAEIYVQAARDIQRMNNRLVFLETQEHLSEDRRIGRGVGEIRNSRLHSGG